MENETMSDKIAGIIASLEDLKILEINSLVKSL